MPRADKTVNVAISRRSLTLGQVCRPRFGDVALACRIVGRRGWTIRTPIAGHAARPGRPFTWLHRSENPAFSDPCVASPRNPLRGSGSAARSRRAPGIPRSTYVRLPRATSARVRVPAEVVFAPPPEPQPVRRGRAPAAKSGDPVVGVDVHVVMVPVPHGPPVPTRRCPHHSADDFPPN
jgi:hypothetical protein